MHIRQESLGHTFKLETKRLSVLSAVLRGNLNVQAIAPLLKLEFGVGAEQRNSANFPGAPGGSQGVDDDLCAGRPA